MRPREGGGASPCSGPELLAQSGVTSELVEGGVQRLTVMGRDQGSPVSAWVLRAEHISDSTGVGRNDGEPGSRCFKQREWHSFKPGGQRKQVRLAEELVQFRARHRLDNGDVAADQRREIVYREAVAPRSASARR